MTNRWTDSLMDRQKNNVALTHPYHAGKSSGSGGDSLTDGQSYTQYPHWFF